MKNIKESWEKSYGEEVINNLVSNLLFQRQTKNLDANDGNRQLRIPYKRGLR